MPKTVQNFISLCDNDNQPNYVGTTFYRALSSNSIQAGAIGNVSGKAGITTSSQMNFKDINELFAYVTYIYDKLFTK